MSTFKDLDVLVKAMEAEGYRLVDSEPGPTDSGTAEFSDGNRTVKIVRDKSSGCLGRLDKS